MLDMFKTKRDEQSNELELDMNNIPNHIAIIMDGNGRWAKERMLPRSMGHKAGVETIRRILKEATRLGVKNLTLYAFSTENWGRPKDEVGALMKLLVTYLRKELDECHKNGVRMNVFGDTTQLPKECQEALDDALETTKNNTRINLNFALNYGGRDEIIRAIKLMYSDINKNIIKEEDINSELIENYLYTKGIPDPDLIIRPSGEQRLSNFLLWQCAYSEFWYSDINWPDFKEEDLRRAISDYQNRDRRFGKVK
ncbi:isoprenyl transferase [Clostridium butyricum]|jgi:undecaprenyl diphosphate synthase|uniref:Isoprenyl transferase n=3 Tax=Clostridium butyricum TaxID=1492 RepID=C4IJD0_CLOBU|nr:MULTISPECIES: isoprenyl transferase [Clostridium]ETI91361.1 MAG: Di-trans,poly-cis-decaprenylcistransferase [Clostridium butyricum DORA_1]APF22572.1 di-trans,poly-cis-decaprenylcistransferase [Clostridium butyricum]EDT76112.1 di-trans,poly-cis-decaprenylcistransferase [Clostridium butyricum 5521]EEP53803.1 undecaprenyl pyrophosphate synthetase 1 [Clostridium butyricum E4 str. BoNT E BL5262]KHD16737.1 UDP pyrophosphate synthase [Clostridium butyricum]